MPNTNKEDELALLRSKVTELESTVLTLRQSLSESELTIQSLVEKLNLARRKRFGSSSETLPPQDLEFNEAETHADTTGEEEAPDNPNDDPFGSGKHSIRDKTSWPPKASRRPATRASRGGHTRIRKNLLVLSVDTLQDGAKHQ